MVDQELKPSEARTPSPQPATTPDTPKKEVKEEKEKKQSFAEAQEAREEEIKRVREETKDLPEDERRARMNTLYARQEKEARSDGLDSFQRHQKKETEEAIAELDEDSEAIRRSPDYSPPNTVRGTEGDNANYRPGKAVDASPDTEWDPRGGEDEDLPENYEPSPIPGAEKKE